MRYTFEETPKQNPAAETKRVGFPIFLYTRRPVGAESRRRPRSSPENLLIL